MKILSGILLRIILIQSMFLIFTCINGQEWPRIYGDNFDATVTSIKEDYDAGYMISGYAGYGQNPSKWGWLIKTDINGNVIWDKKFGNLSYNTAFIALSKTKDQGIILAGATSKYDDPLYFDPLFLKLNTCGEIEWCTILSSLGGNYGMDILQLDDNHYIGLLKYYGGDYQNIRISLVKMDSLGVPVWIKNLAQDDPTIHDEEGYYLIHTSDDSYLVSGHCFCPNARPFWIKTDTSGNQIWDLKWPSGTGLDGQTIAVNNGIFYASGGMYNGPMTPTLFKFDIDGNALYREFLLGDTIVAGGAEPLYSFNDSTLLVGIQWRVNESSVDDGYSEVFMIDTLGNLVKRRQLLHENRTPENIIKTFDDKILVTGSYVVDNNWDIYLWKLNSDLEDDTLYTQPFTYDSLCPNPIPSDTIDLNCGVYVSIDDIPLKEEYDKVLKVFPNPAFTTINFEIKDLKTSAILSIYDSYGRLVEEMVVLAHTKEMQVGVTNYKPGLYLAVLKNSKNILGKERFMVVRGR
ncbi:MAG: T9SS type A sorting domain-containing protein [Bacteroidetes bacterium]|nr:T9SS type A sorting domain-containing protein [Bacteroidota bacterium]